MMETDAALTGLLVDSAAAQTAGVEEVYAARPLATRLLGGLAGAPEVRSHLQHRADGVDVTVSIGVSGEGDSAEVAQRVADSVRAAAGGTRVEHVHVRVSRLVRRP
jgi:hypothetical protein